MRVRSERRAMYGPIAAMCSSGNGSDRVIYTASAPLCPTLLWERGSRSSRVLRTLLRVSTLTEYIGPASTSPRVRTLTLPSGFTSETMLTLSLIPALLLAACVGAQPLVDFQVAQPPPLPQDAKQCTVQILQ